MAKRIDTQARIEAVRLQNQGAPPAAPAAGYSLVFTKSDGLYLENSAGAVVGPFITGSASSGGRALIEEKTPSATGSVSFLSIPGTYKKLSLEFSVRSTQATNAVDGYLQFNGDTTAGNYYYVLDRSNGFGVSRDAGASYAFGIAAISAASAPANSFAIGSIEIIQYANIGFNKVANVFFGGRYDASSVHLQTVQGSMVWANTGTISQISMNLSLGNYVAGSVIRLYGES